MSAVLTDAAAKCAVPHSARLVRFLLPVLVVEEEEEAEEATAPLLLLVFTALPPLLCSSLPRD